MGTDRREERLIQKALAAGKLSPRQYAESVKLREALEAQGVTKPLAKILEDDGAITRSDLEALDDKGLVGETLGGFRIEAKLGEGGMGAVYRARQISLGRAVALKVLPPERAGDREFVERFSREARAAARLAHPHVVQPLEIGSERGYHYFAMELCEGGSVASRIEKQGRFPEREALEVVRAIGLALAYASDLDLIHRDIKPDNILFTRSGIAKLADLGLAKDRADEHQLTSTGLILGTPNYMSPEQALGKKDLDIRSDIYSLGITLFEMVTGRVPFKGNTPLIVLSMHMHEPLPDPRAFVPSLSAGCAALIRKMTAKDREERTRSPQELVNEIDALLGAKPTFEKARERRVSRSDADTIAEPPPAPRAPSRESREAGRPARRASREVERETVEGPGADPPEEPAPRRSSAAGGRRPSTRRDAEQPEDSPSPGVAASGRRGRRRGRTAVLVLFAVLGTVAVVRPDLRQRAVIAAKALYGRAAQRLGAPAPPGPVSPRAAGRADAPGAPGAEPWDAWSLGEDEDGPPVAAPAAPSAGTPAAPPRASGAAAEEEEAKKLLATAERAEAAGDLAGAVAALRAAVGHYDATAPVRAARSELLVRSGLFEALLRLGQGDEEAALAALASLPQAASVPPEDAAVRAICGRADALRADLEGYRKAKGAIAAERFGEALEMLASLRRGAGADFARAAGDEARAAFSFAAAMEALRSGGTTAARPLLARLSGERGKTAFARAHEADIRDLEARLDVEPRLSQVLHAQAAPAGEPRWRFTYRFAGDGANPAALADFHEPRGFFTDAEGLGFRGTVVEVARSEPAVLELPLRRLDAAEIAVSPGRTAGFLLTVGPVHVLVLHHEGRLVASAGEKLDPPGEDGPVRRRRGLPDLPRGSRPVPAPVRPETPYSVRVAFVRPSPGAAPGVEISIDGQAIPLGEAFAGAVAALPPSAFGGRVELRAALGQRIRAVAVEGVPDWVGLGRLRR